MKTIDSADTGVSWLEDGRLSFSIKHELLENVRPKMIVWYLNHMMDDYEWEGSTVQRYRMWHPRDHIALTYIRPGENGENFGKGALVRIQEAFGANPKYGIDSTSEVQFLDETGFSHISIFHGLRAARMDYKLTATEGGTLYENSLVVGLEGGGFFARWFNKIVRPLVFSEDKGRAWLKHNIEEVGNFQFFLPEMYAAEVKAAVSHGD